MKQRPSIRIEKMNDHIVFHTLFFLCLALGLFFGAQSHQLEIGNDGFQFLNSTEISSEHATISDPSSIESATVESEEKEEKEEKESESETNGSDIFFATASKEYPISIFGGSLSDTNGQFLSYSRVKLYLLFHCLKSDLG